MGSGVSVTRDIAKYGARKLPTIQRGQNRRDGTQYGKLDGNYPGNGKYNRKPKNNGFISWVKGLFGRRLIAMTPPVVTLPDAARRSLPSSPSFENSAPTSIWLPCAMVLLVLALVLWFFRRRFTAHKKPLIPRYHEDEIKPSPLAIEL